MVNSSNTAGRLPGAGRAHRFINQCVIPPLIGWATVAENGAYELGQSVRKHPGKSMIWSLAVGFAFAVAEAKRQRERRKI